MVIPGGVLEATTTINITKVENVPPFNNGYKRVGRVIDFGPGGIKFSRPFCGGGF